MRKVSVPISSNPVLDGPDDVDEQYELHHKYLDPNSGDNGETITFDCNPSTKHHNDQNNPHYVDDESTNTDNDEEEDDTSSISSPSIDSEPDLNQFGDSDDDEVMFTKSQLNLLMTLISFVSGFCVLQ